MTLVPRLGCVSKLPFSVKVYAFALSCVPLTRDRFESLATVLVN